MAQLNGFDATTVEPASFEPIPAGKYESVITASEMKQTKAGNGEYLQLTFQIVSGEFKNRVLWARLNLKNSNPMAVQIARGELSAICRAVCVMAPKDSVELHNLPLLVHVKQKKRQDTGEVTNEIKGYSQKVAAPVAATTAEGSDPPWKKS